MSAINKATWWFKSFRGFPFRAANANIDLTRAFQIDKIAPTGTPWGEYKLNGGTPRMPNQTATFDFVYPSTGYAQASEWFDTLLVTSQQAGTLRKTDGNRVRQTEASIASIGDATTIDDLRNTAKRTRVEFDCEPFWYAEVAKTIPFTTATTVTMTTAARRNEGIARAVKHLILTITTPITASEVSPFVITITPDLGTAAVLNLNANMVPPVIINAGTGTVTANGVNVYRYTSRSAIQQALLFIEGRYLSTGGLTQIGTLVSNNSVLTFSAAVSGSLTFRDTFI